MAGYTNNELNQIYSYLGFNFYVDFEPEVKSVILATQATADGGTQPDGTLQAQVLSLVTSLQTNIDAQLVNLAPLFFAQKSSAGSVISPQRADFMLRKQGRALIKQLCIIFGMKGVRQDFYGNTKTIANQDGGMSFFPQDY